MQTLLTTSSIIMKAAKIIIIISWYLRETFSFCKWMFTFIIYFYLILFPWWSWVSHGSWNSRYAISSRNCETGNSLVVQWLRLVLSLTRTRVQSLIGELRSCKPWLAKNKKKRERETVQKETMAPLCLFPFNYLGILLFSSPVWKFTVFSEKQKNITFGRQNLIRT